MHWNLVKFQSIIHKKYINIYTFNTRKPKVIFFFVQKKKAFQNSYRKILYRSLVIKRIASVFLVLGQTVKEHKSFPWTQSSRISKSIVRLACKVQYYAFTRGSNQQPSAQLYLGFCLIAPNLSYTRDWTWWLDWAVLILPEVMVQQSFTCRSLNSLQLNDCAGLQQASLLTVRHNLLVISVLGHSPK